MNNQNKKIIAQVPPAAAAAELIPIATEVANQVGNIARNVDKAEQVAGADTQKQPGDADFLNDLNTTQQAAVETLAGFGIDRFAYQSYENELMRFFPSRLEAAKFIQNIAIISSSSAITFQETYPVVLAIYKRNIKSPERAIAIARTIAKYESQNPGLGLFNMAYQAATGQFNPAALTLARTALMGSPSSNGNMNETRDLQQAFDGINAPSSPLGAYLNKTNLVQQRMEAEREQLLMQAKQIELQFATARNLKLTEVYDYIANNLPEWVRTNKYFLRDIYTVLSTITYVSSLKDTTLRGLSVGGKSGLNDAGSPQIGFVNPRGASVNNTREIYAQTSGVEPTLLPPAASPGFSDKANSDLPEPPGILPPSPQSRINSNISSVNNGNINDVYSLALQEGVLTTEQSNNLQKLLYLIQINKTALDTNYNTLVEMLSAGAQPQSMFGQGYSTAPYATPQQIDFYASTANQHATTLVQLIQSLLTTFLEMQGKISGAEFTAQGGGLATLSALLRNQEAIYRSQLKEAQQKRIQIFDISVMGPIDQEIRALEPKYREMEAGVDMMNAFNNVGADYYVMPFAQIAMKMSALYYKASEAYASMVSKLRNEPGMAQYCKARAEQMQAAGLQAKSKGLVALRNLMKQQSGGVIAESDSKNIRLGEDAKEDDTDIQKDAEDITIDVEAKPMGVGEYWDKLYHDNPPYGEVIEHPEKHRDTPTWKMRSKHKITRLK
jgi:hypothetical protein